MEEKKHDIKETMEVLEFLTGAMKDLAKHKEDDGKISTAEWLQATMANAPAGLKAVRGIDKVDDEIKDLDHDESKVVASKGMELAQAVMSMFGMGE